MDEEHSGEAPRRRPNAGYHLSGGRKAEGEELTFYYNRDRRLAKAPQAVQDLYAKTGPRRFGLLQPLIGSKPRALLFFSILLLCASILVLSLFGYFDETWSLEGNSLAIQALRYEGAVIVAVNKTVKKSGTFARLGAVYAGAVDVAVSPAAGSLEDAPPVFYHRIFFSLNPAEEYRFAVPFDSSELVMVFQTEKNTLTVQIKTD
jgi:hypothetical protein